MNAFVQQIPVTKIAVSDTEAQVQRRRRFDQTALQELAESIKSVGLLQPVVARPVNGHFELVAGERRFLAAQAAGLAEIPVSVRELTDEQVLEVQLIENLQREGLHELAEAEGYEALMKRHGYTVEDLVAKVGKSRGYVYARLKLLALGKDARRAFWDGKITASVALLLARIPVEPLQAKALKEVTETRWGGEPMSYRRAVEHIHENYMLALSEGGFSTTDATLVPAAGACNTCPNRTGAQPELFADVKAKDTCTDPVCFQAKRKASAARKLEVARESGRKIHEGAAAKKILPYGAESSPASGFHKLDDRCWSDRKNRTYRQILGKSAEEHLQVVHLDGAVVEVVHEKDAKAALKARGEKLVDDMDDVRGSGGGDQREREKKAKRETAFRDALYRQVREKLPRTIEHEDVQAIAKLAFSGLGHDTRTLLVRFWGVDQKGMTTMDTDRLGGKHIERQDTEADLALVLHDIVHAGELKAYTWSDAKPTQLLESAKSVGIDPAAVRKQLQAAEKAKPARKAKK